MGRNVKTFSISTGKNNPFFSYKPSIKRYEIVDSVAKLEKLSHRMSTLEEFAFDTETNTLRVLAPCIEFCCVCITISWGEYDNYYVPIGHRRREDYNRNLSKRIVKKLLGPIFSKPDIRLIGQNIKFDMHVLKRLGISITTLDLWDTMILSWLCDENTPNGLKENTAMRLGIDQSHFKDVISLVPKEVKRDFGLKGNQKATYDLVLIDDGAPYALGDSFYTWENYLGYINLVSYEKMTRVYKKVYQPFLHTLFNMEERGVSVNQQRLKEMSVEIASDMEKLEYKMYEIAGVEFNAGSSQQLAELFFGYIKPAPVDKSTGIIKKDKKGLEVEAKVNWDLVEASFNFRSLSNTKNGAPATDNDTFWNLSSMTFKNKHKQEGVKVAKLLMEYKKLSKLRSAFVDGLLEQLYSDGKTHPSFNIIGTDSGRISCSNPNLQQLPKADEDDKYKIRSLFIGSEYVADDDGNYVREYTFRKNVRRDQEVIRKKIVALDFSNLEMRVLGHFSEDANLLKMFANGDDTHGSTAVNMFGLKCTPAEVKKEFPHLRQAAKIINFLLMYGGSARRLYDALKSDHFSPIDLGAPEYLKMYHVKDGLAVAQIYIDKYFSTYSGVAKFIRDQKKFARNYGYVETLLHRKRRLPDINSTDFGDKSYSERLAVNSAIQGSAADITGSAQNRINADPWFEEHGALMIIQVHDEIVFECPEPYVEELIERAQRYMSHPFGDNVELNLEMKADADSGDTYQDAK